MPGSAVDPNTLNLDLNPECWQLSTCSCSKWAKNYICKHVISMSKNAGYFQSFPAVAVAIETTFF